MAQRSHAGQGRICGIYTMGMQDPYAHDLAPASASPDSPYITTSIGEDYADCQWPLTVKVTSSVTREQLLWYLTKLYQAVDEGFFMDPAIGPAIYWRWSGFVIPGLAPEDDNPTDPDQSVKFESSTSKGKRATPGGGPLCGIYLVDDAAKWMGNDFYGKIHADTAVSGAVGEDFAESRWPIVAKIHAGVTRQRFCDYLQGLVACVEHGLFFDASKPKEELH